MSTSRIRVLVVEDSLTARKRLTSALAADPGCEVVGEATRGDDAIRLCGALRPDVMTLDMILSGDVSGLDVTEHVMAYFPTPILVVSASVNRGEVFTTFDALAAGAVEVLEKPCGTEDPDDWDRTFRAAVKLVARIKVITHPRRRLRAADRTRMSPPPPQRPIFNPRRPTTTGVGRHELIAVGGSTGGPGAVAQILRGLPRAVGLPILLVIHVGPTFGLGLAEWLAGVAPMPVTDAVDGEPLPRPGTARVIVAPPERHLVVEGDRLRLSVGPERNACRPSVDVLFESVARALGPRAIGCLLTGMGRDGAEGLLAMKKAGATTIAQDESTSVVFGMPHEAIRLGAADHVLPLGDIGSSLNALVKGALVPGGEK
jgi:two-component system chemotaxis response regulator CheB